MPAPKALREITAAKDKMEHLTTHSTRLRNISIRVGDQLDVIKQEVADKNIVTTESLNKLIHTWEEANEALILCYEDIFQIHTLEARAMESFQRYLRRSWKRIDRFEKEAEEKTKDDD